MLKKNYNIKRYLIKMQNTQENNPYVLDDLEERIKQPLLYCMKKKEINIKDIMSWIYFINNFKRINDANRESDINIIQSQMDESILISDHIQELHSLINEKRKELQETNKQDTILQQNTNVKGLQTAIVQQQKIMERTKELQKQVAHLYCFVNSDFLNDKLRGLDDKNMTKETWLTSPKISVFKPLPKINQQELKKFTSEFAQNYKYYKQHSTQFIFPGVKIQYKGSIIGQTIVDYNTTIDEMINLFNTFILNENKVETSTIVFRGMNLNHIGQIDYQKQGFLSFTTNIDTALNYINDNCCLIMMYLPKDYPAYYHDLEEQYVLSYETRLIPTDERFSYDGNKTVYLCRLGDYEITQKIRSQIQKTGIIPKV
jgi:hypothetical protein